MNTTTTTIDTAQATPLSADTEPQPQDQPKVSLSSAMALGGLAAAALAGCGGGGAGEGLSGADTSVNGVGSNANAGVSNDTSLTSATSAPINPSTGTPYTFAPFGAQLPSAFPNTSAEASRFLGQASLETNDKTIARVMAVGYEAWLNEQLAMPLSRSCFDWLIDKNKHDMGSDGRNFDNAFNLGGYIEMIWYRYFQAPDVMRQRVVLAWSELFVITAGQFEWWRSFINAGYLDQLERHAFGNFRDMLEAMTLNVGMGMFLNMKGNQKADPSINRVPDENYAREIMQLFTIGLYQLNPDGSLKRGRDGKPIETYTNDDVSGLAAALTGWDDGWVLSWDPSSSRPAPASFNGANRWWISLAYNYYMPMWLFENRHSTTEKRFLGVTIPAGTKGKASLKIALDTLFNHPNTGPFIAKHFIQRLVTSNPSRDYVRRVAAWFANNGQGVRGDMAAVIKAVLLDPEARQTPTSNTFGKLREPMIRALQWGRSFGAKSHDSYSSPGNVQSETSLGQMPIHAPSVFNFFRPGYVPPNTSLAAQRLVAPEFQILTEPTVAGYINYLTGLVSNGTPMRADYTPELPIARDPSALVDRYNLWLAAGQLSAGTLATIKQAVQSIPLPSSGSQDAALRNRIYAAVVLVMSCPEYLIQK